MGSAFKFFFGILDNDDAIEVCLRLTKLEISGNKVMNDEKQVTFMKNNFQLVFEPIQKLKE